MSQPLRIGTRGSPLAVWQAKFVAHRLRLVASERSVELVEIQTEGDQIRDVPLTQVGGEGVFTKSIQQALLENRVDVAVHSLKDLPTIPVDGLMLAAVPIRGAVGDVLVSKKHPSFASLPQGATLATGSPRRRAQVLHRRPDLTIVDLRGNVETRLQKLDEQNLDGIILAEAGLDRLGKKELATEVLDRAWMLPAVGQGALGLECRDNDGETQGLLLRIDDEDTHKAVLAERALLRALGGGCHVPIGALGSCHRLTLVLRGVVLSRDGKCRIENHLHGSASDPEALGRRLADDLIDAGAKELLTQPA